MGSETSFPWYIFCATADPQEEKFLFFDFKMNNDHTGLHGLATTAQMAMH